MWVAEMIPVTLDAAEKLLCLDVLDAVDHGLQAAQSRFPATELEGTTVGRSPCFRYPPGP